MTKHRRSTKRGYAPFSTEQLHHKLRAPEPPSLFSPLDCNTTERHMCFLQHDHALRVLSRRRRYDTSTPANPETHSTLHPCVCGGEKRCRALAPSPLHYKQYFTSSSALLGRTRRAPQRPSNYEPWPQRECLLGATRGHPPKCRYWS